MTENNQALTIVEQATIDGRNHFKQGLNCTECVMTSFMNLYDTGFDPSVVALATGFGGGLGDTKNTCGAITGAVMALSSALGRRDPMAQETVKDRIVELKEIYAVIGEMIKEIEGEYGTLICKELSDPLGEFEGKARKKNCMQIIGYCSGLAMKYAIAAKGEENLR